MPDSPPLLTRAAQQAPASTSAGAARELRAAARDCLEERDLDVKVSRTAQVFAAWRRGEIALDVDASLAEATHPPQPGLPHGLVLADPARVPRRGFGSTARRAAFVHAIAHIEWNAINLAWDAVWRFASMPREFYDDWARVAAEEATHFSMLRERLRDLGSDYGRMSAHAGLWQTAEATTSDVLDRMALVPRVLEARGLDVTPGLILKLKEHGDDATAAILEVVLRDEVGHVRTGSRWFHELCRERGLAPAPAFCAAISRHFRGRPQPAGDPGAVALRREAGFTDEELEAVAALAGNWPGVQPAVRQDEPAARREEPWRPPGGGAGPDGE